MAKTLLSPLFENIKDRDQVGNRQIKLKIASGEWISFDLGYEDSLQAEVWKAINKAGAILGYQRSKTDYAIALLKEQQGFMAGCQRRFQDPKKYLERAFKGKHPPGYRTLGVIGNGPLKDNRLTPSPQQS